MTVRSRDLIVFGEDWGGLPSSTQHLIGHLSASRNILWVNSIGLRRPGLSWRDIKRAWTKFTSVWSVKDKREHGHSNRQLHIINPITLPAPRTWLGRRLATFLLVLQIRPTIKKANITAPILWTSLPTAIDISGKLGESALVYYCGDDFSALAGVDHETVTQREHELVERADLILAASDRLMTKFPGKPVKLLPHGVNVKLFSSPVCRANDLPDDGRPIAGFYGSISEWLDVDLLKQTITRLPDWHFVLIGKAVIDTAELQRFDNVHLLGERDHQQLPSYSRHWTVSLLPFLNNAQIRACNPLKLLEYLAAGRPVISTDFPALDNYRHLIDTVNGSDAMVKALQKRRQSATVNALQSESVRHHDWADRAQQVSEWMEVL